MTLSVVSVVASIGVVALVGASVRPRTRRPITIHQDSRSFAMRLEQFVGNIHANRLERRPVPPSDVAEWCDQLARRMQSGSTLREALTATIPSGVSLAHETVSCRLALERGQPIASALKVGSDGEPSPRRSNPHVNLAFTVITIAARLGGSNAMALERTAGSLRLRAADQHERLAQAAQARLSAHVLTVVPLSMLVLLLLIDPDVRTTVQSPIGVVCIALGLVLNAVGWKWMRHIIGATR